MPITAVELLRTVGLSADGPVVWGSPVRANGPGIYVVEWPAVPERAPVDISAVGTWLSRVPTLAVDGERPTGKGLAARLARVVAPRGADRLHREHREVDRAPRRRLLPHAARGRAAARCGAVAQGAHEPRARARLVGIDRRRGGVRGRLLRGVRGRRPGGSPGEPPGQGPGAPVRQSPASQRNRAARRGDRIHGRATGARRAGRGREGRRPAEPDHHLGRRPCPGRTSCSRTSPAASPAWRSRPRRRTQRARSVACSGNRRPVRPARWDSCCGPGGSPAPTRTWTVAGRSAAPGEAESPDRTLVTDAPIGPRGVDSGHS